MVGNELLFRDENELTQKAFLEVLDLQVVGRASLIQLLSELEFAGGISRLLNHARYENGSPANLVTYLIDPKITREQFFKIAQIYANHTGSSMPIHHLNAIRCSCAPGTQCNELSLQNLRKDHSFDYVSPKRRLEEKHGPVNEIEGIKNSRLSQIVDMMERIDPEGITDFDVRLNKKSAKEFGCVEVIDGQVRDAPYGAEHLPDHELKTLCYLVSPKGKPPFIIMVNTMASKQIAMNGIKTALEEAGWGRKFDIRPADIGKDFGIEKGEVHPLSLAPNLDEKPYKVIHLYDESMCQKSYVTTNGGHSDWTTEFRIDTFVNKMEDYFNISGQPPLVIVADINKKEEQVPSKNESIKQSWEHEKVRVMNIDPGQEEPTIFEAKKAAVLITETTTLFAERIKNAIRDPENDSSDTTLHIYRQPSLDFEVVKFPQCWRTIFEQLAIGVATMVREQINLLFLDCNIMPLEEMFADKMPPKVRKHVIEVLRSNLNELLSNINDDDLISAITGKISLISKPVVITDYLRRQALEGNVKNVFLVGGSQISDPSMSKYHDGLASISDLIKVHTLDSEQIRYAKIAMYFAEQKDAGTEYKDVLKLYEIVKSMLSTIEKCEKPLITIASTSLCQTYHDNGNEIIPKNAVEYLAKALNISVNEMEKERTKINAIPVLNTTEVYAQSAAEILASNSTLHEYSYI